MRSPLPLLLAGLEDALQAPSLPLSVTSTLSIKTMPLILSEYLLTMRQELRVCHALVLKLTVNLVKHVLPPFRSWGKGGISSLTTWSVQYTAKCWRRGLSHYHPAPEPMILAILSKCQCHVVRISRRAPYPTIKLQLLSTLFFFKWESRIGAGLATLSVVSNQEQVP